MAELTKDEQIELLTAALLWYAAQSYTTFSPWGDTERYDIGRTARYTLGVISDDLAFQAQRIDHWQWLRDNVLSDKQRAEQDMLDPLVGMMVEKSKNLLCDAGVDVEEI